MEHARFLSTQPVPLSEKDRKKILQLAVDIPSIWEAESTTNSDRQAIIRHLIEEVIVTVQGESEKVSVEFKWLGNHTTTTTLIRPVARFEQLSYYNELIDRVRELHEKNNNSQTISDILNAECWRPPKRRETFNPQMVRTLISRQGIRHSTKKRPSDSIAKETNEWTIEELAQKTNMPKITLYNWMKQGKVPGRKVYNGKCAIWLVSADENEIEKLKSLRNKPKTWPKHVFVD